MATLDGDKTSLPKQKMAKLVVTTGPESCGKTVLAQQLSDYYEEEFVEEYSRQYLALLGTNYNAEDILKIAEEQYRRQLEAKEQADRFAFSDTGLLVAMVWSEYRYKTVDPWIVEQFKKDDVDLYILCDYDIPWEFDPLRENPFDRPELFEEYKRILIEYGKNFIVVSGRHTQRLNEVISTLG